MEDCQTGQTVTFMFKGTECTGEIISVSDDGTCMVSFVYRPGDGRAPESVIYTLDKTKLSTIAADSEIVKLTRKNKINFKNRIL